MYRLEDEEVVVRRAGEQAEREWWERERERERVERRSGSGVAADQGRECGAR